MSGKRFTAEQRAWIDAQLDAGRRDWKAMGDEISVSRGSVYYRAQRRGLAPPDATHCHTRIEPSRHTSSLIPAPNVAQSSFIRPLTLAQLMAGRAP